MLQFYYKPSSEIRVPHLKIVAELPFVGGLTRDLAVNDFHFYVNDFADEAAVFTDIKDRVFDFFTVSEVGGALTISDYLSGHIDRANCRFKLYVYTGLTSGEPVGEQGFVLPELTTGTYNMPDEVAVCTSYSGHGNATNTAILTRKRRTGRLYLGPLNSGVTDGATGTNNPNITDTAQLTIATRTVELAKKSWVISGGVVTGPQNAQWSVWSRTSGAADSSLTPIYSGWVDNEYDTQRRRGQDASHREAWSLLP